MPILTMLAQRHAVPLTSAMRKLSLTILLALALAGCSTQTPHSALRTPQSSSPPPAPTTRIARPDTNTVQLQIVLRKFLPPHHRGPAIWLAGTMHVGEPQYYREVQKFLDAQTVVLFEGVNADSHPRHVSGPRRIAVRPAPRETGTNAGYSMQSSLAESLGLVFQLDAINYDRPNFLNSDLSVLQIQRLMAGEPKAAPAVPGQPSRSNASFDALLQIMDGSSFLGSLVKMGMQFIGSNPKLQAMTKLTLIEAIGRLQGDFTTLRNMPPDLKQLLQVLIEARNQQVISDLKTELKIIPRSGSIAVFYCTGHMEDMEKRLTSELHYRPADEIWLTSFSVDLKKAGITPGEAEIMRNLVKWEMDQMQ